MCGVACAQCVYDIMDVYGVWCVNVYGMYTCVWFVVYSCDYGSVHRRVCI